MNNPVLSQFFDSDDIDSRYSLSEVVAHAEKIYGFDIRNMYCLYTGKPLGRMFDSELEFALAEEISDDIDDLADAMVVRIVASMRPSPALNKPDHLTLKNLSAKYPVDTISYLINRLNGTRDLLLKRDGTNSFGPLLARIKTYHKWYGLAAKGFDLARWTHWLLELDCKMNLHDLVTPKVSKSRKGRWLTTFDGAPLFDMLDESNADELYPIFESWVFEKLGVYEDRHKAAVAQENWIRGNRMTVAAYTRSWIENPVIARRATDAQPKNQPKTVGRPKTPATKKKESKLFGALALLDSLNETIAPKPAPKPVTTPKLKLNLASLNRVKKESN